MTKGAFLAAAALCSAGTLFAQIKTEWAERVTPENAWREYPRPQLVRSAGWQSLNGTWSFRVVTNDVCGLSIERAKGNILVPFPIESQLSGVGRLTERNEMIEYRRAFEAKRVRGERTILRFEGVDYRAQAFVNGVEAGLPHEGAYTAFAYDITDLLKADGRNELMVRVWDPTEGYVNPLGKQSVAPKGCFYTRVSGIWQTVWTEQVPESFIESFNVIPDIDKGTATFAFKGRGPIAGGVKVVVDGVGEAASEMIDRAVSVKIPSPRLWSPEQPNLYTFTATYGRDKIVGYFAMRKLEKRKDAKGVLRFFLNNRPYFIIGTLDQGWWPDGLLTPPSEAAMANDIMTLKACGYNMMRKHIKVEPMRYYALCDKLGLIVLQDMPSGDCNTMFDREHANVAYGRVRCEWRAVMDRLMAVPSILMWIPYNEQWTQPGESLTLDTLRWTRAYDPSHRLVNGPSGWVDYEGGDSWPGPGGRCSSKHRPEGEEEACDVVDRHDYDFRPTMIPVNSHRISFLGEYGGIGCRVEGHLWTTNAWGYGNTGKDANRRAVENKYVALTDHVAELAKLGLAGAVYTQTTDVEAEINGLMTYDRKVLKYDADTLRDAHRKLILAAEEAALTPPEKDTKMKHVVDSIANCDKYEKLNPRFKKAFEFLKRPDLAKLAVGEYPIAEENGEKTAWAMIQESKLKFVGGVQRPEVHAKYIDIQAPLSAPETYGLCEMDAAATAGFDAAKDVGFVEKVTRLVTLEPGQFAIFFPPNGGHAPCLSQGAEGTVRKLIIKVKK